MVYLTGFSRFDHQTDLSALVGRNEVVMDRPASNQCTQCDLIFRDRPVA